MLADIVETIVIEAPRETVWSAMTTPSMVEQWLGCLEFVPAVGAVFFMQPDPDKRARGEIAGATHCEIEILRPPSIMRFTWFLPDTPKTHVTIELLDRGGAATEVRLTHSGWQQFDAADVSAIHAMLAAGWKSHVLPGLKRISEESRSRSD